TNGVDYQVIGTQAYSVADQFELLATAVGRLIAGEAPRFPLSARGLLGPSSLPPAARTTTHLDWPAFRETMHDVLDCICTQQQVPSRVFVGADAVPPADFLVALARVYEFHQKHGKLPLGEGVQLGNIVQFLPASHIASDTPGLFGGWVIHKEGFRAPKLLEVARLQAWTLKPALRKN
ncbi:MAG TPA: hypothetical protein VNZ22_04850, partial [Bacillota bacterium]|nr:hypothetical protein [Bacillota bacterium]